MCVESGERMDGLSEGGERKESVGVGGQSLSAGKMRLQGSKAVRCSAILPKVRCWI